MIPQVAHHPRHLSQQFGNQSFATSPFDPLPQPRRFDRPAPLPFRSSRNIAASLGPLCRAYPVEKSDVSHPSLVRGNSSSHSFGGQYNDPSEHMLRRKTPNGTLAAGYDGTPVQWSSKGPALKHVVLPVCGDFSSQNGTYATAVLDDPRISRRSGGLGQAYQQTSQMTHFGSYERDLRTGGDLSTWSNLPSESSHNVWDQIRTQQASTFYPEIAMQIPTVLQPAYQPSPGPTASNDGGLYGPYWPDGRFVPYRPAAVRDQGLYYHQGISLNRGHDMHSLPPTELLPPFRQLSFSEDLDLGQHPGRLPFATQNSGFATPEDPYASSILSHPTGNNAAFYSISDGSRTPNARTANKASNPRFKEKTLSWAHSIYVDLLAFLHHTKKEGRHGRQPHGFRTYSKNSIYPRPPRQPASYSGAAQWTDLDLNGSNRSMPPRHTGPAPSPPRISPTPNFNGNQGIGGVTESRYARSLYQDVPHYMSPFQPSSQAPTSPLSKAKEALEMLTTLCDQSEWRWIDGMLLGGCLAYGLEEYHKALEWYSKIIAIDPK